MVKKRAAFDNTLSVDGLTIIPVADISLDNLLFDNFAMVYGFKEPVAIIVVSLVEKKAFRINGDEVSVEKLVEEYPGLKEMLEL